MNNMPKSLVSVVKSNSKAEKYPPPLLPQLRQIKTIPSFSIEYYEFYLN